MDGGSSVSVAQVHIWISELNGVAGETSEGRCRLFLEEFSCYLFLKHMDCESCCNNIRYVLFSG